MVPQEPTVRRGFMAPATEAQPSADSNFTAAKWASTPGATASLLSSFNASARRINTALGGFIRADRLDAAEADIVAALADLRELRIHVRNLRALAKAEQRKVA